MTEPDAPRIEGGRLDVDASRELSQLDLALLRREREGCQDVTAPLARFGSAF